MNFLKLILNFKNQFFFKKKRQNQQKVDRYKPWSMAINVWWASKSKIDWGETAAAESPKWRSVPRQWCRLLTRKWWSREMCLRWWTRRWTRSSREAGWFSSIGSSLTPRHDRVERFVAWASIATIPRRLAASVFRGKGTLRLWNNKTRRPAEPEFTRKKIGFLSKRSW